MKRLPASDLQERGREGLLEFLGQLQWQARGDGQARYASITLEVPHIDPLAVLQSIYEPAETHLYLERPDADTALAGADAVASYTDAEGGDRFARARAWAEGLCARTVAIGSVEYPLAGPVFFLTANFAPHEAHGFPSLAAFLPRWQVSRQQGRYLACANVCVGPDDEIEPLAARVLAAHGKFGRFDYSDAPVRAGPGPATIHDAEAEEARHLNAVTHALSELRAGAFEKIVLARRLELSWTCALPPLEGLNRLRRRFPRCHSFSVSPGGRNESFVGASPERLVRVRGGWLETEAIAGSRPRGEHARADAALAAELLASAKDRSEQALVVRFLRERLEQLGIQLEIPPTPRLLQLENVQHLHTPVRAPLPQGCHLLDLAQALHPTPAIGALPAEALARIPVLEGFPRGPFGGVLGWFDARGEGELVVGIRSGIIHGQRATLFAGGGIVGDSDPARELEETRWKLRALGDVLSGRA